MGNFMDIWRIQTIQQERSRTTEKINVHVHAEYSRCHSLIKREMKTVRDNAKYG